LIRPQLGESDGTGASTHCVRLAFGTMPGGHGVHWELPLVDEIEPAGHGRHAPLPGDGE